MKNILSPKVALLALFISLLTPLTTYGAESSPTCKVDDINCYQKYMEKLIATKPVESVLSEFATIASKTNGLNGQCNNYGRFIGAKVYQRYKGKALKYHSDTCGLSFAYGLLAEMGRGEGKAGLNKALQYCKEDKNIAACAYGVGNSMAQAKVGAKEINAICVKNYPESSGMSYEDSPQGICVLGWVSAMSELAPSATYSTIKKAVGLCTPMSGKARDACIGEASFTYTYINNPTSDVRLKRVEELAKNCTSSSEICARFVGKALNDYQLYAWRPDLSKKSEATKLAALITKLCSGPTASFCIQGFVYANSVHTSRENSQKICAYLTGKSAADCRRFAL